jgi:synaptobrevin family protein YKT6
LKYDNIDNFITKWQDPTEADNLLKIEKGLIEVKDIMHQNLVDLIERDGKLDELMVKTETLNNQSV